MKIFYEKLPETLTKDEKIVCLNLLENEIRERVINSIERKQIETLYSHMMAKREIAKILGCEMQEVVFTYNENAKPFIKGNDTLFFNISHSGEYVALAIANSPVGVDIEKIRDINESMIKRVCCESEQEFLKKSDDLNRDFIKLWTLKEAITKAKGTGIVDGMKNYHFDISSSETVSLCRKAEIKTVEEIDGYIISAVLPNPKKAKTREEIIRRSITKKFRKQIWNNFVGAVKDYQLINEGDKIAVCISGGKDSMLLALCVKELIAHSQIPFEAKYIVMDPGYNEENRNKIIENANTLGLDIHIFNSPIFDYVAKQDGSPCYLCAKMRRGYLYKQAKELGCNKIALGHHFDDVIETTMLNILYGSEIKTMMPKLKSTSYEGMELIRPLYMVKEDDIIHWAKYNELEFIRCACRFTEEYEKLGIEDVSQSHKRDEIKNMIKELKKNNPYVDMSIFKSVHNVNLSNVVGFRDKDGGKVYKFTEKYDSKKG